MDNLHEKPVINRMQPGRKFQTKLDMCAQCAEQMNKKLLTSQENYIKNHLRKKT